MNDDLSFIKIQPSNAIMRDKEGRTVALIWIFRPDVAMEKQCWFETPDIVDGDFLCIETGSDKIPISCKLVYRDSNGPDEWEPIGDKKILEFFKFCCDLLKDGEMKQLGGEILKDTFFGDTR
ncbi:hypothetical protein LCGC14_0426580 [marine sediment metagenome]|uniref:Uncharacterized protein n=1 Tax=marine sediment metagenome TaxID=412755 RepID=A0A0F9SPB8_9ZZZZ